MKLYVATEPYKIRKSKEAGEKDQFELADSSLNEGAWAFSHNDKDWYNIATKCTPTRVITDVEDYNVFGKRVTQYHIHTNAGKKAGLSNLVGIAKVMGLYKRFGGKFFDDIASIIASFPTCPSILSGEDNGNDIKYCISEINSSPGCELDYAIVSTTGVMSYKLKKLERVESRYEEAYDNRLLRMLNYCVHGAGKIKSVPETILSIVNAMNFCLDGVMRLEFHPRQQ